MSTSLSSNYNGRLDRHTWWDFERQVKKHGIEKFNRVGLAKLRRDGFISIDAQEEGTLLTKNMYWIPDETLALYINGATKWGSIQAELLGPFSDVIPGFSQEECQPFNIGDQ